MDVTQRELTRGPSRPLTTEQILHWADACHARTGAWPTINSGTIQDTNGESWSKVYQALYHGFRGLPGGSSLARLLAEQRGVRNRVDSSLTKKQVLDWADAHHRRKGKWPAQTSGPVVGVPSETWRNINRALLRGDRGFPGGETLAGLLRQRRNASSRNDKGSLSVAQILTWADAHYRRFKHWPDTSCGRVVGTVGEIWHNIDAALSQGGRGLPGRSSLAKLLAAHRGVPNRGARPQLSVAEILQWADAHHQRTGDWPTEYSGAIEGPDDETWSRVNAALRAGTRGLEGGTSLALLLEVNRGRPRRGHPRQLTLQQILAWADQHHQKYGQWPTASSGAAHHEPSENWRNIDSTLRAGGRGLRSTTSLAKFLAQRRGVRNRSALPPLTLGQILQWADIHYRRTGQWPTRTSGNVLDAPDEIWIRIDDALQKGQRGLVKKQSLARLLAQYRSTQRP